MKTFLRNSGFLTIVFLIATLFFANVAFGQTITLDQADLDYAPGETVTITGTGWQPNEAIDLQVYHLTEPIPDHGTPDPHQPWTTVADGSGNFTATWFVTEYELGAELLLIADGVESGFTYKVFFTDGNVGFGQTGVAGNNIDMTVEVTYTKLVNAVPTVVTETVSFKSNGTTAVGAVNNTTISWVYNPVTVGGTTYIWNGASTQIQNFNIGTSNYVGSNAIKGTYVACTVPSITTNPLNQTVAYGANANFTVAASGTAVLTYQWEEYISSWNTITNGGVYSNATTASLTLTKPSVAMSGRKYRCVVTNSCGNATSDGLATLTVNKKALTAEAPTIASKTYDSNATAGAVTVGTLSGFVGTETVTVAGVAAAYSSANVGSYPGVVVTYTLVNGTNGGLATNYSLATGTATGVITSKAITGNFTASNKTYDGNAVASVLTQTLNGVIAPDAVSLIGGTASFSDKDVANGKTVTSSGMSLSGLQAGNYSLTSVGTTTAN
ncbi:YDG domain-containing protein, partial [Flavobacterium sp. LT1R49]|uniref:YDG domain-containing protein n=1 Tax=Flavobacterium arabinosi TaxID=3398737 RepID=UPI003A83DC5F